MAKRARKMVKKGPFSGYICMLGLALVIIIGGSVISTVWPTLIDFISAQQFAFEPGSTVYKVFRKTPFPLNMDFYFFNWTNPQDIYNASVKPKFQELGPFKYQETKEKTDIVWNENGTISYRIRNTWFFKGKPDSDLQTVSTLNPLAMTAGHTVRDWSYLLKKSLSLVLSSSSSNVNITKTVRELLFDGYADSLITMGKSMSFFSNSILPPWNKFGWFYTRNGTSHFDGIFNMGTGQNGTEMGKLYGWNYWTHTPYNKGECSRIKGTSGEFFRRNAGKDSITFFSADLCRYITLDYVGESTVANILGYKYSAGASLLDNGTTIPENSCFCTDNCLPSGALNLSACRFNAPTFASLPHFYNADPHYINAIDGLNADPKKHAFFVTLEPMTGVPLEVNARLQVNLYMSQVRGIRMFEGIPSVLFPMLWFEQKVQIPEDMAFKLKMFLNLPIILSSIGILLIAVGLILASCAVYKACTTNLLGRKNKKQVFMEQSLPLNPEKNKFEMVISS